MKAKLIFNLDDAEDNQAYERVNKALDMACVLFEIKANLRKKAFNKIDLEYEKGGDISEAEIVFDEIDKLYEKFNINIDEIIT